MATFRESPIFICGHPQAGVDVLVKLIELFPEVVIYPEETGFFRRYLPNAEGKSFEKKLDLADRYLIQIFEWNAAHPLENQQGYPDRDYSSIPFLEVQNELRNHINRQFRHEGDMLSAAMTAFAVVASRLTEQTKYWLEKTPYNERFARQIFQWWPDARCIHVVRDPRENFVSYHRKHPDWTAEFFARNWETSTRLGLRNEKEFGRERYWMVSYENCMQNQDVMLKNIQSFLSNNHNEGLNQSTLAGVVGQFSSTPVGTWIEDLKPQQVAAIQGIARIGMKAMGYNQSVIMWNNNDVIKRMQTSVHVILNNIKETIKWL